MTDEQRQFAQQMNPNLQRIAAQTKIEQEKGQNKLQQIQEQGKQDVTKTLVEKAMDHVQGAVPLELAEARLARNTDMATLQQGAVQPQ
jgi:hypothetical protein